MYFISQINLWVHIIMKQENMPNQTILTSFSDLLGLPQINSEMPMIFGLILEMQLSPLAGLPIYGGFALMRAPTPHTFVWFLVK